MDELLALLDACREATGARVAALVGDDGLLIERSGAQDGASDPYDLEWTAAEATDLRVVADRLTADAMRVGPTRSLSLRSDEALVRLERCGERAFVLLVGDEARSQGALPDEVRARLAEATA